MLLGFVNKAVEYLDKHIDKDIDQRLLKELKSIDLDSLKRELKDNLGSSLGTMQSTISTLLHAGEEAFDDFINIDNNDLSDQINRLFDGDFESEDKDLDKLLEFYSLNNDIDLDQTIETNIDEIKEEIKEEVKEEVKEEIIEPIKEEIIEEIEEENEPTFEMSDEDNELMAQIVENVNKVNNPGSDYIEEIQDIDPSELDHIFKEVVSHEEVPEKKEEEKVDIIKENPGINLPFSYLAYESFLEPKEEIEFGVEAPDKDDIIDLVKDIQASKEKYFSGIDNAIEVEEEDVEKAFNDPQVIPESVEDGYVSGLIDDLRAKMVEEDEKKKVQDEEYRKVYDRIHKTYPYLSSGFIRSVFDLKESIAMEYPLNVKIIILHRCVFKDVENLRQFVEITLNHGYSINANEEKLIVDVFREYTNTDGKIITSIFEVANQSALLNGAYDGYRVMYAERV